MKTSGQLIKTTIVVDNPKEVGRLFTRSRFGRMKRGNLLELNLVEGAFLLSEKKLSIVRNGEVVSFGELVSLASQSNPNFECEFLVYRDLRKRGHVVSFSKEDDQTTFYEVKNSKTASSTCIKVFSERDYFDFEKTTTLLSEVPLPSELWYALVDEEGDITYYAVAHVELKGSVKEHVFPQAKGLLLKDRIVLFDPSLSKQLHEKEFYGKAFGEGLQLSLVEGLYLAERKTLSIHYQNKTLSTTQLTRQIGNVQPDIQRRLAVFRDLKKRGLLVKTGFKFGAHFRAYTKKPGETHAEYLIHIVEQGFSSVWAEISRAVRLAHSVNKEILFATSEGNDVTYVKFGRLKP